MRIVNQITIITITNKNCVNIKVIYCLKLQFRIRVLPIKPTYIVVSTIKFCFSLEILL